MATALALAAFGQEAESGFNLSTTLSLESFYTHQLSDSPREGEPIGGGFRAMLYPTWKLNPHWSLTGVVQVHSRPYFMDEFETQGEGVKGNLLQLSLNYSRFWNRGSVVFRVGELSSAFGSFLLRYDDAMNPLIGMPAAYGYYYSGVSFLGLAGAEVDVTQGKFDVRAQFVNSSPANPRSIFDHDQYGNWAGGVGYTIRQGVRIGASAYYGPYLDAQYPYYLPGEGRMRDLPATAYGADFAWAAGHWNLWAEWQHFENDYRVMPSYRWQAAYTEVRRVLTPRWYAATRIGYEERNRSRFSETYEIAAGFRARTYALLKVEYQITKGDEYRGTLANTAAAQLVFTLPDISVARP
ncbi:MAG TPA: hypothetical protein VKV17_05680 [Bryobacteraceae bacterium]|nr:hypothetical protein [Bryobacteraceae bacterium]